MHQNTQSSTQCYKNIVWDFAMDHACKTFSHIKYINHNAHAVHVHISPMNFSTLSCTGFMVRFTTYISDRISHYIYHSYVLVCLRDVPCEAVDGRPSRKSGYKCCRKTLVVNRGLACVPSEQICL